MLSPPPLAGKNRLPFYADTLRAYVQEIVRKLLNLFYHKRTYLSNYCPYNAIQAFFLKKVLTNYMKYDIMCKADLLYTFRSDITMKNLDYALLLEIYGSMLTDKQRNVMELYYWEDFSLGEISQSAGITRQAVRDSIKRSEQILNEFEVKLCLAKKIIECKEIYGCICTAAEKLRGSNDSRYIDKIEKLAGKGLEIF